MSKRIPFWDRVLKSGGCWFWTGPTRNGYGVISPGNSERKVHRYVWAMEHGPIPRGMVIMHQCDEPLCVNPDHLMMGTQYDNILDCIRKGRKFRGLLAQRCPRGHRRVQRPGKTRGQCLVCHAERTRKTRPSRSKAAILSRLEALK